jgi:hypothetical protein
MKTLIERYLSPLRDAEGGGNGGGDGGAPPADVAPKADPAQVLFGGEGKGEGEKKPADPPAGDDKGGDDWKEYVNDPDKTPEENASAKAEHDKTKPADKKDDNPADKVPDDGKYSLTMPEGVEVDQELLDAIGPDFKDLGLTNGQAQKLADKFTEIMSGRMTKQAETWGNTIQKWADDAKADKEIGGDKWDGTVKSAMRAINTLGTPALKEYLQASGGGNHPELIRVFAKVGGLIKEDSPPSDGPGGHGKPADPAHVLFPNDAPKG